MKSLFQHFEAKPKLRKLICSLCLMASAGLIGLTVLFPEIGFLSWLCLIPACYVLYDISSNHNVRYRTMYGYGLLFFESYYLVTFYWFLTMYPLTAAGLTDAGSIVVILVAWFGLSLFQAIGAALIFPLFAFAARTKVMEKLPLATPFLFAAMWTCLEFWQSNSGWSGVPWSRLAMSQTGMLITVQSASLLGSCFVTFLIVVTNALLAYAIFTASGKKSLVCVICAASLFVSNINFGAIRMNTFQPSGKTVRIAAVQANISSLEKWGSASLTIAKSRLTELSSLGAEQGSELIIWSETVLPVDIGNSPVTRDYIIDLSYDLNASIIAGVFQSDESERNYNSVIAVSPGTGVGDTSYIKQYPVPFGEFVPYREFVMAVCPPLAEVGMLGGDLTAGTESTVIPINGYTVGPMICFDSIYDSVARNSARNGADFLVLSTNDSWWRDSRGIWMHFSQSQLRAIETGRYVVRSANTGVSAIITPIGQVSEQLGALKQGVVIGDVVCNSADTPFVVIGNLFSYICLSFCGIFIISGIVSGCRFSIRKKKETAKSSRSDESGH